ILTSRGGKTSHAAVVARGMGKTCVCGAESIDVSNNDRRFTTRSGVEVYEGNVISIDGTSGDVFLGEVPVVDSPVVQYFEGELDPESPEAGDLVAAVHRVIPRAEGVVFASLHRSIGHADGLRRLPVRTNADRGDDAPWARRFGAQGIGLC